MRTVSCLAIACLIGSAMPAYCQAPQPTDKVKIEVTRANLQLIGQGLMELPFKTVAPVLNDLQAQLNAQDEAAAKAAKAKADEKPADKPAE
jgi:hypothetical protein